MFYTIFMLVLTASAKMSASEQSDCKSQPSNMACSTFCIKEENNSETLCFESTDSKASALRLQVANILNNSDTSLEQVKKIIGTDKNWTTVGQKIVRNLEPNACMNAESTFKRARDSYAAAIKHMSCRSPQRDATIDSSIQK